MTYYLVMHTGPGHTLPPWPSSKAAAARVGGAGLLLAACLLYVPATC